MRYLTDSIGNTFFELEDGYLVSRFGELWSKLTVGELKPIELTQIPAWDVGLGEVCVNINGDSVIIAGGKEIDIISGRVVFEGVRDVAFKRLKKPEAGYFGVSDLPLPVAYYDGKLTLMYSDGSLAAAETLSIYAKHMTNFKEKGYEIGKRYINMGGNAVVYTESGFIDTKTGKKSHLFVPNFEV